MDGYHQPKSFCHGDMCICQNEGALKFGGWCHAMNKFLSASSPYHQIAWVNPEPIPEITSLILTPNSSKLHCIDGQHQHLRERRLQHCRQEALQLRAIAWQVRNSFGYALHRSNPGNAVAIFRWLARYTIPEPRRNGTSPANMVAQ